MEHMPPRRCRGVLKHRAPALSFNRQSDFTPSRRDCQHFSAIFLIFFTKPCKPLQAALIGRMSYLSANALKRRTSPYSASQGHCGLSHARAHAPARFPIFAPTRTHARTLPATRSAPLSLRAPSLAPERAPHTVARSARHATRTQARTPNGTHPARRLH